MPIFTLLHLKLSGHFLAHTNSSRLSCGAVFRKIVSNDQVELLPPGLLIFLCLPSFRLINCNKIYRFLVLISSRNGQKPNNVHSVPFNNNIFNPSPAGFVIENYRVIIERLGEREKESECINYVLIQNPLSYPIPFTDPHNNRFKF